MGFWKSVAFLLGIGTKDFRTGGWDGKQPNLWDTNHRLNRIGNPGTPAHREDIENDFESYVEGAYKANGPVFACMAARGMVFSEATFQWRRYEKDKAPKFSGKKTTAELADLFEELYVGTTGSEEVKGRPGDLFGNDDLKVLEKPWPGGTTGELLQRMLQDADLAGNFYATMVDDDGNIGKAAKGPTRRIARLRPDWVTIMVGTKQDGTDACYNADARVLAYVYHPKGGPWNGTVSKSKDVVLLPEEVCHFSPNPDPLARFRGMSWMTPVVREIQADSLATTHKKTYYEEAAVPNIVVRFDKEVDEDTFDEFVEKFNTEHKGAWNAYRTLFLMGGADVTALTTDFNSLQFTQAQGKYESRIAAAAGVPSSWVGFSEGLTGSGLNSQGVFTAARRRFADGTIRPLWRMAAASLQNILTIPAGAHLWYDERGIAFLREDAKDAAEIMSTLMNAADAGIKAGFQPDAVVVALRDNSIERLLGGHTGLVSVQMQMPKTDQHLDQDAEEAAIRQVEASTVVQLAPLFTLDSIALFMKTGDVTKLQKDPVAERQRAAAAQQQERAATAQPDKPPPAAPAGGAPKPASGQKPPASGKPNATGGKT